MTVIRDAEPADLSSIHAIDMATFSPTNSPGEGPDPGTHRLGEYPAGQLLVAESATGRVQGYLAWGHPTPLASSRHVMQIQGLAVHPDHQGAGVGTELLDAVIALARHRGATKLSLRVLGTNVVARRMYTLAGFVVEGVLREEFLLQDRPVDDLLMAHYLGDQADQRRTVDAPRKPLD